MPHRCKRLLCALFFAVSLLSEVPCHAAAPQAPTVSAQAYILMDADSGRILCARNETAEMSIASTTKIMTALVALEEGDLSRTVTVKPEHWKEGSSMYLQSGEQLTLEELLYGLLLPSGNDAAECIADTCGAGVAQFVRRMNERASALGLTHTAFANPSGLEQQGHYSCARDLAVLAACAMREPTFARIASTKSAAFGARELSNHNKLLGVLDGCIGLKTGYTGAAGRTLVTCAERGGLRLIAVTLNDGSDWDDHTALYEYGYAAYTVEQAIGRGERAAVLPVQGGTLRGVEVTAAERVCYPVCTGETLRVETELPETLQAPLHAGDAVGTAHVFCGDTEVGSTALVCACDVPEAEGGRADGLWLRLWRILIGE